MLNVTKHVQPKVSGRRGRQREIAAICQGVLAAAVIVKGEDIEPLTVQLSAVGLPKGYIFLLTPEATPDDIWAYWRGLRKKGSVLLIDSEVTDRNLPSVLPSLSHVIHECLPTTVEGCENRSRELWRNTHLRHATEVFLTPPTHQRTSLYLSVRSHYHRDCSYRSTRFVVSERERELEEIFAHALTPAERLFGK